VSSPPSSHHTSSRSALRRGRGGFFARLRYGLLWLGLLGLPGRWVELELALLLRTPPPYTANTERAGAHSCDRYIASLARTWAGGEHHAQCELGLGLHGAQLGGSYDACCPAYLRYVCPLGATRPRPLMTAPTVLGARGGHRTHLPALDLESGFEPIGGSSARHLSLVPPPL
jgi:hypothetical protein